MAYSVSLIIGGVGFALIPFLHDQYLQFIPFLMIGAGWAAMLAMPFTFVTNALQGYGHMGAYLGLFNGTICIPQIVAAICGGTILGLVGSHQSDMMIVAGVLLIAGALSVGIIKVKNKCSKETRATDCIRFFVFILKEMQGFTFFANFATKIKY